MVFPKDGSALEVWKQGYASCLWQVLGVARLLQVLSAGQADIVTSQLQLWQEARGSSKEMAQEAAQQAANDTAQQLAQYLDRKLEKVKEPAPAASTPTIADRMIGPMADMAGKQMANMFGKMFGGMFGNPGQGQPGQEAQANIPQGWEYTVEGGK
jgi:glutathione S-transferase